MKKIINKTELMGMFSTVDALGFNVNAKDIILVSNSAKDSSWGNLEELSISYGLDKSFMLKIKLVKTTFDDNKREIWISDSYKLFTGSYGEADLFFKFLVKEIKQDIESITLGGNIYGQGFSNVIKSSHREYISKVENLNEAIKQFFPNEKTNFLLDSIIRELVRITSLTKKRWE